MLRKQMERDYSKWVTGICSKMASKDISSIPANTWSPAKHITNKETLATLAELQQTYLIFFCHLKRLQKSTVKWLVGYYKIWFLREHKTASKCLHPVASVKLAPQDRCFFSHLYVHMKHVTHSMSTLQRSNVGDAFRKGIQKLSTKKVFCLWTSV